MALNEEVRRIVTTVDGGGKAVVLFDGANPHKVFRSARQLSVRRVWVTDQAPADISGTADRGAVETGIQPPDGGSIFCILDFLPSSPEAVNLDHQQLRAASQQHPFMHRTRTIDYAAVISGEIDMLLDDSEVHLKAGDVLVQQDTNHA